MREQIQLLIAQHKMLREEAEQEMDSYTRAMCYEDSYTKLDTEVEMRSVFISELENLIS